MASSKAGPSPFCNATHSSTVEHRALNERLTSLVPPDARAGSVPIVAVYGQKVAQYGTGTLFRVADHFFLITAGHVLRQASEDRRTIGIGNPNDGRLIALRGQAIMSSPGQYGTSADPFDVGLLRLDPEIASRLSMSRFLNLSDVDFTLGSGTGIFMLYGYPAIWSAPSHSQNEDLKYKVFEFTSTEFTGDSFGLTNYQRRFHVLVDAEPRYVTKPDGSPARFVDRNGYPASFPRELGGISGCSLWKIGDMKTPSNQWCQRQSKLVAIQTGTYPDLRLLKATRWIAASTLIHEAFPQLRSAMQVLRTTV